MKYQGMIAPCGMNCGLCIGHLRKRKPGLVKRIKKQIDKFGQTNEAVGIVSD